MLSGNTDRDLNLYPSPSITIFVLRTVIQCTCCDFTCRLGMRFISNAVVVSSLFLQHSNPGHAGPFPVVSVHNNTINPTSPTTATMASANRGPTSPSVTAIELIPSVTNPENLPSLPDIPPIQVSGEDFLRPVWVPVFVEGFNYFKLKHNWTLQPWPWTYNCF